MECPNCKHCLISGSSPPTGENDSAAIPPVVAPPMEEKSEEEEPVIGTEEDLKGPKVPCVVCFNPVTGITCDRSKVFEPLTPEEKECDKVFQWFLISFRRDLKAKGKIRKGQPHRDVQSWMDRFDQIVNKESIIGWDGEGGKSYPLPFCESCKNDVVKAMETKISLKSLKRKGKKDEEIKLKQEMKEIRRKMSDCESDFGQSGIYEKDKRYHRVRIGIFKIHWTSTEKRTMLKLMAEVAPPPREVRRPVKVVEIPCIICCKTLKIFPEEVKTMKRKVEDRRAFRWFLNYLQNPPGQVLFPGQLSGLKGKWSGVLWDGKDGKSEPLQFCGGCREGILEWIDINITPKMKTLRAKEIRMMKERMKNCEDEFGRCGIYRKDKRYFNVRRKVIKVLESDAEVVQQVKPKPEPKLKLKRRRQHMIRPEVKTIQKNVMDRILAQGFREMAASRRALEGQGIQVVMKEEEDEEEGGDQEWKWEEDDEEEWPWEDEEPAIVEMEQKVEMDWEDEKDDQDVGMEDPLCVDTNKSAFELPVEVKDEERDPLEVEINDLHDKRDDHHRNCLLCNAAIYKKSALAPVLTNDLNEQNFNSVFILRKMLNVPKERLVGYLENFGCPGKWVEYCTNCLGLVDQALRLQKEITWCEDKLRRCQEKMVLIIKATSNRKKENTEKFPNEIFKITEESRQWVKTRSRKKFKKNVKRRVPPVVPAPEVASDAKDDNDGPLESTRPPYNLIKKPVSTKKVNSSSKLKVSAKSDNIRGYLREKDYTCSLCPNLRKPMSLAKFYRHVIFHNQRPFKCSICNVYWSSPAELEKNPFVKENASGNHICSEATLVKIPNGKFNPGNIWNCKWCPVKFDSETERDSHEEESHSSLKIEMEMKYKCLSCSKAYRSYREWLLHRVLEHPQIAAVSCLFCDYSAVIKTKEGIDILDWDEMKKHTGSKHLSCKNLFVTLFTCDFCGIPFWYKSDNLTRHIKSDHRLTTGLSTYGCPCCHYRTDRLKTLRNHFNLRHSLENPGGPSGCLRDCDICGLEGLSDDLMLMDHKMVKHGLDVEQMEEYTGQEILKCEREHECGGFRTLVRKNLGAHMTNKHLERKWKCEICGRAFMNRIHHRRHLETHDNTSSDDDSEDEEAEQGPKAKKRAKISDKLNDKFMKETLNEEMYTCSLCPNLQNQPMSLDNFYRHVIFHKKRSLKCSICNVHWSSVAELEKNPFGEEILSNEHICSEATLVKVLGEEDGDGKFNPGKIWNCEWCPDKKFDSEKERDSHEQENHSSLKVGLEMKHKCLSCSVAYRSYREWLLHRVLEHADIAGISCLFCDFTSVIKTKEGIDIINAVEMRKHVNWEHSACKDMFIGHDTCDFCGLPFRLSKEDKLGLHIKDVHKLNSKFLKYSCPCCYNRVGWLTTLRKHFKSCHSLDPPPPPSSQPKSKQVKQKKELKMCDICGIKVGSWLQMCNHKMVRHGMGPEEIVEFRKEYKVINCEKAGECGGFRALIKETMRQHMMKKHGAERKWKCEQCGKGFMDNDYLRRHMEIHRNKGLRPYQCEICGNSFAVKNYLYIHMRLSHQNRPFASTNRKRTGKKGQSRTMDKMSEVAESQIQGSSGLNVPVSSSTPSLTDLTPTQLDVESAIDLGATSGNEDTLNVLL